VESFGGWEKTGESKIGRRGLTSGETRKEVWEKTKKRGGKKKRVPEFLKKEEKKKTEVGNPLKRKNSEKEKLNWKLDCATKARTLKRKGRRGKQRYLCRQSPKKSGGCANNLHERLGTPRPM